ncbi:hydroxyacid-oxoacid transhydrogenase [Alicyclobacillus kakegawensis]|uniref:hydroxyacid-oxoacid transhydrogenase n=1 Tax=Alicyclobacillus kakegawensis TaxID=392012 RepID=UPI000829B161|nr:hydroxyacid-oxoacid transhydrogenase [Alicyclobacillus kakegawensis]
MNHVWEFWATKQIVFGVGSIQRLRDILNQFNARSVLVITDPGVCRAGILDSVLAVIEREKYVVSVYDKVVPEPPVATACECYEYAKSECDPDVIIGLGGGSSIDLAKVTALLLAHGGHPSDYFGENRVPASITPLIAIPTTAGTGSEVTPVAVLTDVENNLKVGISDNHLRPEVALLDPELTLRLPKYVTACSGIDALAHAIEAYTAKSYQYVEVEGPILFQGALPISDALARHAIELIAENLPIAVHQGSNLKARSNMLLASTLAGMAFSNAGTALAHALAYPIGGLVKSPHGEVTGLLLPYVMEFNATVAANKLQKVAGYLGARTVGLDATEAALAAPRTVLKLVETIGLPTHLSQIGIQETDLAEIAEKTLEISRLVRNNPRVPTKDELIELVRKAL